MEFYCSNRKVSNILCFKTFALGIKGIFAGNLGFSGAEDAEGREGIGNLQISPEFTGMPSDASERNWWRLAFIIRIFSVVLTKTCIWVLQGLSQQHLWCHDWLGLFPSLLHSLGLSCLSSFGFMPHDLKKVAASPAHHMYLNKKSDGKSFSSGEALLVWVLRSFSGSIFISS